MAKGGGEFIIRRNVDLTPSNISLTLTSQTPTINTQVNVITLPNTQELTLNLQFCYNHSRE